MHDANGVLGIRQVYLRQRAGGDAILPDIGRNSYNAQRPIRRVREPERVTCGKMRAEALSDRIFAGEKPAGQTFRDHNDSTGLVRVSWGEPTSGQESHPYSMKVLRVGDPVARARR